MANINGTDKDDNPLNGTSDADRIFGLEGNDLINGLAGNDQIEGGTGQDAIFGGSGNDEIYVVDTLDTVDGGGNTDLITFYLRDEASGFTMNLTGLWTGGIGSFGTFGTVTDVETLGLISASEHADNITIGTGYSGGTNIRGYGGADVITGGSGYDTIEGGDGNDILYSGRGGANLIGGAGNDDFYLTSISSVNAGGSAVERLNFDLRSALSGIRIDLTNTWTGGSGMFGIGGGTITGVTFLFGNNFLTPQDDVFIAGAAAFSYLLFGEGGADVMYGGDNVDRFDGGSGNDVLVGNAGSDVLTGGLGSDEMIGGIGNDSYLAVDSSDSIVELPNEGNDQVTVAPGTTSFVLSANLESLTNPTAQNFTGIGNALNNEIVGNILRDELQGREGNDTLRDGGGADGQEDTLIGGTGNDIYYVGVRGSSTIELPGEGVDEVRTDFNIYGLQPNVENLTATGSGNHQALVGNDLDNVIYGESGVDDLFGREGNDTLHGGYGPANTLVGQEGNDTYYIAALGDTVLEFANQGVDTVNVFEGNFTLPANVEILNFIGTDEFIGIGNSLHNSISGAPYDDFLNGKGGDDLIIGGDGSDELFGEAGSDQFRYEGIEIGGIDRIYDFEPGVDKIGLLIANFSPTAVVTFLQTSTPAPANSNSTLIYDPVTGIVSYDRDGNGLAVAVQLTQLNAGLTLSLGDFVFV